MWILAGRSVATATMAIPRTFAYAILVVAGGEWHCQQRHVATAGLPLRRMARVRWVAFNLLLLGLHTKCEQESKLATLRMLPDMVM